MIHADHNTHLLDHNGGVSLLDHFSERGNAGCLIGLATVQVGRLSWQGGSSLESLHHHNSLYQQCEQGVVMQKA
jgi:hypothetical protein